MEYYIAVTRDCNLNCSFCFWNNIESEKKCNKLNPLDLKKFIENTKKIYEDDSNVIVFYGGEPLLNQDLIEDIINVVGRNEIIYCLYTNGILLHTLRENILNKLSYIAVSIDGDKEFNDKHRGEGSFNKVIDEVIELKRNFKGEVVARLTLTPENSLGKSVLGIINYFDHIYWQFESSPKLENSHNQLEIYNQELDLLLDFWLRNMEEGRIYNIIPFQCITTTLLWNKRADSLRCGCGTSFIFIDTDGNCYSCDELINYNQFHIGNIYGEIKFSNGYLYKKMMSYCEKCSIRDICGGRCISAYVKYSQEKFLFYCENSKILIDKIKQSLPRIKKIIDRKCYSREFFDTFLTSHIFEGIP
ncbi:MAG: radical SAM protein [Candidatus Methanoperedens sp.]